MLRQIALLLAIFPFSVSAGGPEAVYSMEARLPSAQPVQPEVARAVEGLLGRRLVDVCEGHQGPLLEGTSVPIGPSSHHGTLVKPAAACLCGVNSCHFWIFLADTKPPKLLAEIHSHTIAMSYREGSAGINAITATSGPARETVKQRYRFDGNKFKLVATERDRQAN